MKKILPIIALAALSLTSCYLGEGFTSTSSEKTNTTSSEKENTSSSVDDSGSKKVVNTKASFLKVVTGFKSDGTLSYMPYPLTTYLVSDMGDVPYVNINAILNLFGFTDNQIKTYTNKDNVFTFYSACDLTNTLVVDPYNDTMTFKDYDRFVKRKNDSSHVDLTQDAEKNVFQFDSANSGEVGAHSLTYDFKKYDIDLVYDLGNILAPFAVLNNLLVDNSLGVPIVYNGDDYYLALSAYLFDNDKNLTNYGEELYSGSWQGSERSREMADFTYKHFVWLLDNFYGLKEHRNISSFLNEETLLGIKNSLTSTDPEIATKALYRYLMGFIDDGHTSFTSGSLYRPYDKDIKANLNKEFGTGERHVSLVNAYQDVLNLRATQYGETYPMYETKDNVGFIRFDGFMSSYANYYTTPPTEADALRDNFALFYIALNKFNSDSNIDKVVIDLSANAGGVLSSAIKILGIISSDPTIYFKNIFTGSNKTAKYMVDVNLDGKYNSDDHYFANKFEYYILTSNFSFSCGNLLPSMAQELNAATIIGERSGGGACSVYSTALADGTLFNTSSFNTLCRIGDNGEFYDIDDGCPADVSVDRSNFFNLTYLVDLINSL